VSVVSGDWESLHNHLIKLEHKLKTKVIF